MNVFKPCPVCGGTEFSIDIYDADGGHQAFVICELCDEFDETQGPVSTLCKSENEAEQDAIRVWNVFASTQPGPP